MEYVYDMTWAEFCIRSHAYKRIEKKEWYKVREIAYYSYIAPHVDPKKIPKTKEIFMPLEDKKKTNGLTNHMLKVMRQAKDKYEKSLKDKINE